MHSPAVEDYLKGIYKIAGQTGEGRVSAKHIAAAMRVAPGTVTAMMKSLQEQGLVDYVPFQGCALTPVGESIAVKILRKHRLLEIFLVKTLGIPVEDAHPEAELLEHGVSNRVMDLLDRYLGYPETDPMGKPIPRQPHAPTHSLFEGEPGKTYRIVHLGKQVDGARQYLESLGLSAGALVGFESHSGPGGAGLLVIRGHRHPVSTAVIRNITVTSAAAPSPSNSPEGP